MFSIYFLIVGVILWGYKSWFWQSYFEAILFCYIYETMYQTVVCEYQTHTPIVHIMNKYAAQFDDFWPIILRCLD